MQTNNYCSFCGTKLELKELAHEGLVPFCKTCSEYRFPLYNVAVSMIIVDKEEKNTLLIKQYNTDFYRFVAGYVNRTEDAEEAVIREMQEEIGIKPIKIKPLKTGFYEKTNTLMLNYLAVVDNCDIIPNYEIDSYKWFNINDALDNLKDTSLAKVFFKYYLEKKE